MTDAQLPPWYYTLQSTKLIQMSVRPIVTVYPSDPISVVFEQLVTHRILAAVVVDPKTEQAKGFVDVQDILSGILQQTNLTGRTFTQQDMQELISQGPRFAHTPCDTLMNLSGQDPLIFLNYNCSLLEAAKVLQECHRAVVVDENNKIFNVIAQTDLVGFLLARHNFMERQVKSMVEEGLVPSDVVGSINEEVNVMGAMRYMRDCGVSGIAVTNNKGQVITNFSATDVLGVLPDKFHLLSLSVKDFLLQTHGYLRTPVVCKIAESADVVMMKMDFYKVHRVYVVDQDMKPHGFISMTDVIFYLANGRTPGNAKSYKN